MDKPKKRSLVDGLEKDNSFLDRYRHYRRVNKNKAWAEFCRRVNIAPHRRFQWKTMGKYAAMLLLPVGLLFAGWLYYNSLDASKESLAEILPGNSQAVLVLSDGHEIALDSMRVDPVSLGGSAMATVVDNHLSYQTASAEQSERYNTLLTKRGGEYRILLEDGTKVHLNADSRLKYPIAFGRNKRVVYLQGEAYFEIAPDKDRPFYVITDKMEVKQYGTAFNVNAYPGEKTEVVLVRGSVGVTVGYAEQMLEPGQLAELPADGDLLTVTPVDVNSYIAWNEGRFFFDNQSLKEIADILSRWYDIDIRFKTDGLQSLHFTGSLDRYDTIEPIIQAISSTVDVQAEIKGHVLYISK